MFPKFAFVPLIPDFFLLLFPCSPEINGVVFLFPKTPGRASVLASFPNVLFLSRHEDNNYVVGPHRGASNEYQNISFRDERYADVIAIQHPMIIIY